MGDGLGIRQRLLVLVEILTLYTDEFNLLTVDELIEKLGEYGYVASRRTVLSDIKELNRTAFNVICVNQPSGKGYYLAKSYSYVSLHLMLEAVYSSTVLSDDDVAVIEKHLRSNVCLPTLELLTETTKNLNFQSSKDFVSFDALRNLRLAIHSGRQACLSVTRSAPASAFSSECEIEAVTVNPWRIVVTSETVALVFTLPDKPDEPKFITMRRIVGCEILESESNNAFDGDPLASRNFFDGSYSAASRRMYGWLVIRFDEKYAELVENHFDTPLEFRRSAFDGLIEAKVYTLFDEKLIGWLYIHSGKITAVAPKELAEFMSRKPTE